MAFEILSADEISSVKSGLFGAVELLGARA
jgi:hypothetical protein